MTLDPATSSVPPDGRPMEVQPRWRLDFPIDQPDDQYIARRDFTRFMVLTSFAFVVGQFGIVLQSVAGRARAAMEPREIVRLDSLVPGSAIAFTYPGPNDACLLLHRSDGSLLAYSQRCTHLSCAVVPQMEQNRLLCPCHDGVFDLASGRPLAGPPRRPLPRIRLEVRDGVVFATGVEPGLL